jgi:hypothetical protein
MIPHQKYNNEFRDEVKAIYDFHLLDLDTFDSRTIRAKDDMGLTTLSTPSAYAGKGRCLNLILYPDPKSLPKDREKVVNEFIHNMYPTVACGGKMIAYPWIDTIS